MHLLNIIAENQCSSQRHSQQSVEMDVERVATIGNFDGVHRGHQSIIRQVVEKSKALNARSLVMTFEPLPQEFFQQRVALPRLNRFSEKFHLLKQYGIDEICCFRFNARFAGISANDFISEILIEKLKIKHLIVGDDFKFGHNREGDFNFLKARGEALGLDVHNTDTIQDEGNRISSTLIRKLLMQGEFDRAESLLGHPYFITAHVMHGDKRGRQLGFPTANLALARKTSVLQGVYAVTSEFAVKGIDSRLEGIANVGFRPTVAGEEQRAEVHFFDFDGDLYGKKITINFLSKIRDEIKFDSLPDLVNQIYKDCDEAKKIHAYRREKN